MESPHSSQLGDGMFFSGKSRSPSLRLWDFAHRCDGRKGLPGEVQSVLFDRQATWRRLVARLKSSSSSGSGLDVMSPNGPLQALTLMSNVLYAYCAHVGTLTKFLVDGKGLLFLLVFGLPPLVHPDGPMRAVLASAEFGADLQKTRNHGPFWSGGGKELLRHQLQPKRLEYTVPWVTW